MVILGVDFGDVRTGLAACDKYEMMAHGEGTVKGGFKRALEGVLAKAAELGAELIVVGNPKNMNGTEGPRSEKCREFAAALKEAGGIETVLYDERLTTVSAHRFLADSGVDGRHHRDHVDELSARLILEDYMTFRRNTKG